MRRYTNAVLNRKLCIQVVEEKSGDLGVTNYENPPFGSTFFRISFKPEPCF